MFNPSQDEVRRFFCEVFRKHVGRLPLTPLESIAASWVDQHPEYHPVLSDEPTALRAHFDAADSGGNPFLHLSMHLAIAEQLSIDQPPGIRSAWERIASIKGDEHAAAHEVMECLGEVLWT
ncbi:MAG: DUF1841 family protein, partial [Betaproteobacteria bacterium]|nr:DUF1841 family protein [Betaproteobacteria bacterium]